MIDFTQIKDAAGWTDAAQGLLSAARDAAKGHDLRAMKQASASLLDFIQNRTSTCPQAVVDAVVAGQGELTTAISSSAVDAIDAATVQLSAFLIDVQRVSADLNQKAKLIKLEPVIDALQSVTSLVNQAKALQSKLNAGAGAGQIDGASVQSDVGAIIAQLTTLLAALKKATGQG